MSEIRISFAAPGPVVVFDTPSPALTFAAPPVVSMVALGPLTPRTGLTNQVLAILAGKNGYILDPLDLATLFQDSAGTVPVTALGQPVGRINSKGGTVARNFTQATSAARPLAAAKGLSLDGVDDRLTTTNSDMGASAPFFTRMIGFNVASTAVQQTIFHSSINSVSFPRMTQSVTTAPNLLARQRRLDADSTVSTTLTGGSVTAGRDSVLFHSVDYAGTGFSVLGRDGLSDTQSTIPGTPGNTEATNSAIVSIGSLNVIEYFGGIIGRVFFARFALTAPERALVELWIKEAFA
jgi:hypothetical protein